MKKIPVPEFKEGMGVYFGQGLKLHRPKATCQHIDQEGRLARGINIATSHDDNLICLDCLLEWASTLTTEDENEVRDD